MSGRRRPSFARPTWAPYLRDRHSVPLTLARLALCAAVLVVPVLVPVPVSQNPLPLALFLPLAFAIAPALTLPERLGWLGVGSALARLRMLRILTLVASDTLATAVVALLLAATHTTANLLGTSLAVLGATYFAAMMASSMAWLSAAALGTVSLLSIGQSATTLSEAVAPDWGVGVWLIGATLLLIRGPSRPPVRGRD